MASQSLFVPPPTFEDPFVEENGRLSSEAFNYFVTILLPRIGQTSNIYGKNPPYEQTGLNAAVPPTPLALGTLSAGYYRITTWLRLTTADGVSSTVQPVIEFPSDGVTCQMAGTAMTSDNVARPSSSTLFAYVDSPGPISFGTNYASNTPGQAVYKATVIVERVQ